MRGVPVALLVLGCGVAAVAAATRPRLDELAGCDHFGPPPLTSDAEGRPALKTYVTEGRAVLKDERGQLTKHETSKVVERVLAGRYRPVSEGEVFCVERRRKVLDAAIACVGKYCLVRS